MTSEEGDFLALDLGGTNFRVLLCKMRAGQCESVSRNYNVPEAKLHGPAAHVFDHIAHSIHQFLQEMDLRNRTLPLGIVMTFIKIRPFVYVCYRFVYCATNTM